ncbi:hypothetical protein MJO28_012707 [Puccinia striiformis f. sp. tritici]|uniref:Uncharacterized protein n=1 Tax=Puccinia striiformis f. sp. tritici TaxID=168172 RepID=A0ACC0E2U0_9BASI|nr:hypothetical protein MJO28_012707 [Puccinia striiformis f. sp. tritici]
MAESTSQTSDGSENQQLQNQIEAVIGKFTILRNNCNPPHLHDDPGLMEAVPSNISMEETSFKERLMLALGCHYLPTLQRQLTTLLRSLDPSGLPKEAESRLKIVSECQADLEQSISAINIAIAVICPEPTSGPHRVDDQDRQRFKSYRLRSLKSKYLAATRKMSDYFVKANDLLADLKLSPEEFSRRTDTTLEDSNLMKNAARLIGAATETINGSELDLVQDHWKYNVKNLDDLLEEFERLVKIEGHMRPSGDHDEIRKDLAKLAIPIIKLIRLFFSKLSRRGMNRKQLPSFTDMCSAQIESLVQLAGHVAGDMVIFQIFLTTPNMFERASNSQDFERVLQDLKDHFVSPLLVVLLNLVPTIPDTDGFFSQTYYRSWFSAWNTQLVLATGNFIKLAKSLDDDPL